MKNLAFQLRNRLAETPGGVYWDELSDLQAAAAKLVTDIDTTITAGQAAASALHKAIDAANATIATDTATITDLQSQLAAIKTAAVAVTNSLAAADQAVTTAGANLNPPVTLPPAATPTPTP